MAYYRSISVSFWTDSKVVDDFSPEDKYIYLYIMTNPHTNLCGCYEVSLKQIANETGYNTDSIERILKRLDSTHNVIHYSKETKELLILKWSKYNWTNSEKLNKPILDEIKCVKNDVFRAFLADQYNKRNTVSEPYVYHMDTRARTNTVSNTSTDTEYVTCSLTREVADKEIEAEAELEKKEEPIPQRQIENQERHKHGQYGWVRLTDQEHEKLKSDLGESELQRCITYVDESAQSTANKNKWRDWNLVLRKCNRERWGVKPYTGGYGNAANRSGGKPSKPYDVSGFGRPNTE